MKTLGNAPAKGVVFEIERYALHDGPGIRTVVFLKGCPLRCWWCCNPESQNPLPELIYRRDKCIGCQSCIKVCPSEALSFGDHGLEIAADRCTRCGLCEEVCGTEALMVIGREMTALEVLGEILKDVQFYRKSGGGVTFSGGEPFQQKDFLIETLRLCHEEHIHTAVETCGLINPEDLREALPYIDLFLYDFKEMIPELHQRFTGVSNEAILKNFIFLIESGRDVTVRIPIIPSCNYRDENIDRIIRFLRRYAPGARVDLLPYHRLGKSKYNNLKKNYALDKIEPPAPEDIDELRNRFEKCNMRTTIYG